MNMNDARYYFDLKYGDIWFYDDPAQWKWRMSMIRPATYKLFKKKYPSNGRIMLTMADIEKVIELVRSLEYKEDLNVEIILDRKRKKTTKRKIKTAPKKQRKHYNAKLKQWI